MNDRKTQKIKLQTVAGMVMLTLLGQCRSVFTVESAILNNAITIDADLSDWKETVSSSINQILDIGVANDNSSLYIGIKSSDPEAINQVFNSGLTLWFSNDNPRRGRMGIRFPTGLSGSAKKLHQLRTENRNNSEDQKIGNGAFDIVEIIGPDMQDTVPMKLSIAESFGLNLKISLSPSNFIYELRIPIHSDKEDIDSTIPVIAGSMITIDIESPKQFSREGGNRFAENHRTGELFGSGQSNFPGYPGRSPNRMVNSQPTGANQKAAEPFSIKLRVKLQQ